MDNNQSLFIQIGAWDIHSQKKFKLINLFVKFQHFFEVFSIENIFWFFIAASWLFSSYQSKWEWVWNINHFSIYRSKNCTNDNIRIVVFSLLFHLVIKQVWQDLWLNYAMLLFSGAHAKVQIGFYFVRILCVNFCCVSWFWRRGQNDYQ